MTIILTDDGEFSVETDSTSPSRTDGLWLRAEDALRITGWQLKPEGMCRGELCVPMPSSSVSEDQVDVAALWRKLGAPVVTDASASAWVLGRSAEERTETLESLDAPDFELPDLSGALHRLSRLRGRKVFLTTWASW